MGEHFSIRDIKSSSQNYYNRKYNILCIYVMQQITDDIIELDVNEDNYVCLLAGDMYYLFLLNVLIKVLFRSIVHCKYTCTLH